MSRSDVPSRRALFIVITDLPGGAERVAFNLASELAERPGWEVEVVIVCTRLTESFSANVLPPGIRVRFGPFKNWYLSFPLMPFRLLFGRYDLVFTTHVYTNALLSMLHRIGVVHIGRHVSRESTTVFDRSTGLKKRFLGLFYRLYGGEDLLITQTSYMAAHVKPWLPTASAARIRVLANPVNAAAIEQGAREPLDSEFRARLNGRRNILFCGRLTDIKRPEIALDAFRIATDGDPGTQLVFMGGGPLEPKLRAKVAAANLHDRVLFLGFRTNPYPVMAACRYGLLTSEREGFPNVVLEMMACGIAKVVMTPCAGDLDQLAGVAITESFDAESIGGTLQAALQSGEDSYQAYRAVVRSRSVAAYLDQMLSQ